MPSAGAARKRLNVGLIGLGRLGQVYARELATLFVILHVSYGATDLCVRVLEHLDAKTGTAAAKRYRSEALEVSRASTASGSRPPVT